MNMQEDLVSLFKEAPISNLTLKNRFIKAGCFEGMSQNGGVSDQLIEHHKNIVLGGTAMTTVAYCSVSYDGRAFDHELWMRKEVLPDLKRLTSEIHSAGGLASIQLGHCGYFASPKVIGKRPLGASPKFNLFRMSYCRGMTKTDITEKINDFVDAAAMAKESGFDAIEIHAGHGYLLSQFLSGYTNKRTDQYGGTRENRMRFPKEVVMHIRDTLGPDFPILVKMNLEDGMSGGLKTNDAVLIAQMFEKAGASAIIPSCGFTSKTPLYMLRGYVPVKEMVRNQNNLINKVGLFLFGKMMVQHYPYTKTFLLDGAKKIKNVVSIPVIYIGGIKDKEDVVSVFRSGFDFAQLGRTLIHDPDFVNKLKQHDPPDELCDHCNRCVAAMDAGGVYCVSKKEGYLWE